MKKFKSYFLAALGFAALAGSLVFADAGGSNAASAGQAPQDVKVVNTAVNPVPILAQGTTNIAGAVQAQQSGSWNVGITGTPTIQVGNTQAEPIPVLDTLQSARQPVMIELGDALTQFGNNSVSDSYQLPAGKRLMIEQAYLLVTLATGGEAIAYLRVYNQGPSGSPTRAFPLLLTKQGTLANYDTYVASGPTKLYVTGPVFLRFEVYNSTAPNFIAQVPSLSGYLEPAP